MSKLTVTNKSFSSLLAGFTLFFFILWHFVLMFLIFTRAVPQEQVVKIQCPNIVVHHGVDSHLRTYIKGEDTCQHL